MHGWPPNLQIGSKPMAPKRKGRAERSPAADVASNSTGKVGKRHYNLLDITPEFALPTQDGHLPNLASSLRVRSRDGTWYVRKQGHGGPSQTSSGSMLGGDTQEHEEVYARFAELLGTVSWPRSKRLRLVENPSGLFSGFNTGLTDNFLANKKEPWLNVHCRERPNLVRCAAAVAKLLFPEHFFTNIQFNKNVTAKLHVDEHDIGPQCILGCGSYQGRNRSTLASCTTVFYLVAVDAHHEISKSSVCWNTTLAIIVSLRMSRRRALRAWFASAGPEHPAHVAVL